MIARSIMRKSSVTQFVLYVHTDTCFPEPLKCVFHINHDKLFLNLTPITNFIFLTDSRGGFDVSCSLMCSSTWGTHICLCVFRFFGFYIMFDHVFIDSRLIV